MKRLLVLGWLILTASVVGQVEHAPTVAQCQADQRLWLADVEERRDDLPAFEVLGEWNREMLACEKVDRTHAWNYSNTSGEIVAESATRTLNFIYPS